MQEVKKPVAEIFGPWPVYVDGVLYGDYETVFVVAISQYSPVGDRTIFRYWKDDSHILEDGATYGYTDQDVRFSHEVSSAAGFRTLEEARAAFDMRAVPYMDLHNGLLQQAFMNNIRVLTLKTNKEKRDNGDRRHSGIGPRRTEG